MWTHSLFRLLLRALVNTPSLLSSNWLAAFLSIVLFSVPQLVKWGTNRWKLAYLKEHWRADLRVGVITVSVCWLLLFAVSVGKAVYIDHDSLTERIQTLTQQNSSLKTDNAGLVDPKSRDELIKKLNAEIKKYQEQESPTIRAFVVSRNQRPGVPLMEYVLTSGRIRTPVDLLTTCDFPINDAVVSLLTEGNGFTMSSSKRRISTNEFEFNVLSPAWSSSSPLWITIYFEKPVDRMPSCKFSAP